MGCKFDDEGLFWWLQKWGKDYREIDRDLDRRKSRIYHTWLPFFGLKRGGKDEEGGRMKSTVRRFSVYFLSSVVTYTDIKY